MTCEMVNFDTLVGGARSDGSDGSDAYQGQPQWTKINLLDRREVIKAMAEVVSAGPTRPAEMMVDHMRDELAMHQVHILSPPSPMIMDTPTVTGPHLSYHLISHLSYMIDHDMLYLCLFVHLCVVCVL